MKHAYTVISFKDLSEMLGLFGVKVLGGTVLREPELVLFLQGDMLPDKPTADYIPITELVVRKKLVDID